MASASTQWRQWTGMGLAALLLTACTRWGGTQRVETIPVQAPERARYRIWVHGAGHEIHSLRSTPDYVSGVSWLKDPRCADCRVAFARREIDSIQSRVRAEDDTQAAIGGSAVIALFAAGLILLFAIAKGGTPPG